MHKQLVTWAVLVTLGQGVAVCGRSNYSSAPLAPTPLPLRQRPLVDLTGQYLLSFEADSCEQLPKELRRRTYEASIGYAGTGQNGTTDWFHAQLTGADFHEWAHLLAISVVGNSVHIDLSDNIVVEKPAPDTYLMIAGSGGTVVVQSPDFSTISTAFEGFFEYCVTTSHVRAGSHCPTDATVHTVCRSRDSRWTLTRR